jgi:hypothetical protein
MYNDATDSPPVVSSQTFRINGFATAKWPIEVLYVFCNSRVECIKFPG